MWTRKGVTDVEPGTYDFPAQRRGDTFLGLSSVSLAYGGESPTPIPIASARMQVRRRCGGGVVHEWTSEDSGGITIDEGAGNVITVEPVAADVTESWATGDHEYDLEATLTTGEVWTILAGVFPVHADITR